MKKFLLAALAALSFSAPAWADRAPLVVPKGDILQQVGWFNYDRLDGAIVLYCVETADTKATCSVYFEKGFIALVEIDTEPRKT